jgi:hypothetical protein
MSAAIAPRGSDQINSIAEVLAFAFSPLAVRRIVHDHAPDSTGHCSGCRFPTTAAPVWPCRLWEIATEAERIRSVRRPS